MRQLAFGAGAALLALSASALAETPRPAAPSAAGAPAAAPARAAPPQLGRMQLQAQYAGPLQDTLIQRWRDPIDGVICYVYLPVTVQHSPPTASGFVQYGSNGIGSISCVQPRY